MWNWRDQLIDLSLYSRCLGTTDARTRTGQLTASDRKKKLSGNFSSSYQQKLFGFFNFKAPTEFTMAKIKKKGMLSVFYFFNVTANSFFLRYLWRGQKLYHPYPGRAQTSDFFA